MPARDPLHHLMELFDAVAAEVPDLQKHRESFRVLEELRTTWVSVGLNRWPVDREQLPAIFAAVMEVIQHLGPESDR